MENKKDKYNCVTPDLSTVASANECTGLMYRPPETAAEYDSYQQMYGMEIPKQEYDRKRDRIDDQE